MSEIAPMNTIHRVMLSVTERQKVRVHFSSKVLNITNMRPRYQHMYTAPKFEMWFTTVHNAPENDYVEREIIIVGTGCEMPADATYHLGSVTLPDGNYVWHLFSDKLKRAE